MKITIQTEYTEKDISNTAFDVYRCNLTPHELHQVTEHAKHLAAEAFNKSITEAIEEFIANYFCKIYEEQGENV